MRLKAYLSENVIKPDLKFFINLIPKLKKELEGKDEKDVLRILNKTFAENKIKFEKTSRQSSDDELAAAGVSYGTTETKAPFKITIYLDDFSVFETKEEIEDYWVPAILKILGHELIHRTQFAKMKIEKNAKGFKTRKDYMGDIHEIMALAYDTFIYWLGEGMSKQDMENQLNGSLFNTKFERLQEFLDYFNPGSKEYSKLMQYLRKYVAGLHNETFIETF